MFIYYLLIMQGGEVLTRLAVISDIHCYSPRLGCEGRAYELRSGSDQKCLAESGAVIDAALKKIAASPVDALLIAGDITNDGEMRSHEEIFGRLSDFALEKPLYLITSTHDWCSDENPRRFEGNNVYNDVPVITKKELSEMYSPFGADREIARFQTKIGFFSRVFQVSEKLRLIAVNDDCDGENGASGYSPEHLEWMLTQIRSAKNEGCDVIAMEHHLLMPCIHPLINSSQTIANRETVAQSLADAGLRLMLVGHSHMQRTTEFVSPEGNKITQINVGSLCGYPAPIVYLDIEGGVAHARVEPLKEFEYQGKIYSQDFFKSHVTDLVGGIIEAAICGKTELAEKLQAQGIHISILYNIYPIIRVCAKKLKTLTVGKAARLINLLTFSGGIDKEAVKEVKNDKLLPHVYNVMLNVFDGSQTALTQSEAVKQIVTDVSGLPKRVIKKLPMKKEKKEKLLSLTGKIEAIGVELMYPSKPDNKESDIAL